MTNRPPRYYADTDLRSLGVTHKAVRALRALAVYRLADFSEVTLKEEVFVLPGLGRKTVMEIRASLQGLGMDFKPPRDSLAGSLMCAARESLRRELPGRTTHEAATAPKSAGQTRAPQELRRQNVAFPRWLAPHALRQYGLSQPLKDCHAEPPQCGASSTPCRLARPVDRNRREEPDAPSDLAHRGYERPLLGR